MSRLADGKTVDLMNAEATEHLGAELAARLRPGDALLLEGPLGAGKTTLTRGLVEALGGDPREVCSPTFVLLESYAVKGGSIRRVHHADLYRLRGRGGAAFSELGLGEALDDPDAVTVVEWPEDLSWEPFGQARVVRVRLVITGERRRAVVEA